MHDVNDVGMDPNMIADIQFDEFWHRQEKQSLLYPFLVQIASHPLYC